MPSRINVNFPVFGKPTTASVRNNFAIASEEITELQARIFPSVEDVPILPAGEVYVRRYGAWAVASQIINVDGGTFP